MHELAMECAEKIVNQFPDHLATGGTYVKEVIASIVSNYLYTADLRGETRGIGIKPEYK